MGHSSRATMMESISKGAWTGINEDIPPKMIHAVMSRMHCTACALCKMHKLSSTNGEGMHGVLPGEELSVDYQGKVSPVSVRGFNGFYLFKDKFSGFRHAIMVKDKTAKTYLSAVDKVIKFYNSYGQKVEKIRCDAGSTENDSGVVEFLNKTHFIKVNTVAVEHQNQNFVEREVQTLIRGVGCLLVVDQQALSSKWWCYAVESWVQTANARPNANPYIEDSSSCEEIVTGVVPDVQSRHKFPFGCPVTSIRTGIKDQKYDPVAEFGIAIGTTSGENGSSLILLPGKGIKPVERFDVQTLLLPSKIEGNPTKHMEENMPETTSKNGVLFKSPITTAEGKDSMESEAEVGTIGFGLFDAETTQSNNTRTCRSPRR